MHTVSPSTAASRAGWRLVMKEDCSLCDSVIRFYACKAWQKQARKAGIMFRFMKKEVAPF